MADQQQLTPKEWLDKHFAYWERKLKYLKLCAAEPDQKEYEGYLSELKDSWEEYVERCKDDPGFVVLSDDFRNYHLAGLDLNDEWFELLDPTPGWLGRADQELYDNWTFEDRVRLIVVYDYLEGFVELDQIDDELTRRAQVIRDYKAGTRVDNMDRHRHEYQLWNERARDYSQRYLDWRNEHFSYLEERSSDYFL